MALLLYRIRQPSKLNSLSNQITRCYSQISFASSFNYTTKPTASCLLNPQPWSSRNRLTDFCYGVRLFAAPSLSKSKKEAESDTRLNEKITARFIRLVTDEGHGVVPMHEALTQARSLKLDLVEVQRDANPPVCKIMDYHKEKYKFNMKLKERAKSKSEVSMRKGGDSKEVRFSDKTEQKDLKIKADQIIRLMERGYRVKCMVTASKKRKAKPKKVAEDEEEPDETDYDDEGAKELATLLSRLTTLIEDVAYVESGPKVDRKQAFVVVRHAKFGPNKKGGTKKLKDVLKSTEVPADASSSAKEGAEAERNNWSVDDSTEDIEEVFGFSNYLQDSVAPRENLNAVRQPTGVDVPNFSRPRPVQDSASSFQSKPFVVDQNNLNAKQQPTGFNVPNFTHARSAQDSTSSSQTKPPFADEMRYRRNEPRNQFHPTPWSNPGPNMRDSSGSEPRFNTPRQQHQSEQNSTFFSRERKQTGSDSWTGRSTNVPSDEIHKRQPSPTSPNTQTPRGYGIFSSTKPSTTTDPNARGSGVNCNNAPTDGGQQTGVDHGGKRWGIFSKEGHDSSSVRPPKAN